MEHVEERREDEPSPPFEAPARSPRERRTRARGGSLRASPGGSSFEVAVERGQVGARASRPALESPLEALEEASTSVRTGRPSLAVEHAVATGLTSFEIAAASREARFERDRCPRRPADRGRSRPAGEARDEVMSERGLELALVGAERVERVTPVALAVGVLAVGKLGGKGTRSVRELAARHPGRRQWPSSADRVRLASDIARKSNECGARASAPTVASAKRVDRE